jgi:hypothetical protein
MSNLFKWCLAGLFIGGFIAGCNSIRQSETETDSEKKVSGAVMLQKAMEQEFRWVRDPQLNYVPRERIFAAKAYMESLQGGIAARTAALDWDERGPINVGGRTRAMIVDKRDATGNTVFAGSVSGGMFKTTNYLSPVPTWTIVNDFLPNLAIGAMVQDNTNQNIMYAGTGEGWFNFDAVLGNGIYKSTDGGITWNVLPSTIVPGANFQYVQDLVIDNNGNLFASTRNATQTTTSTIRGVLRSTDGGATWTQVLGAPLTNPSTGQPFATGRAADLEVASNGDIYASLGLVGAAVTNRSIVMKSSFATHGANTGALGAWIDITPVTPTVTQRTEILVAPSDPQRVYLLMQDSATHQVLNIFRSTTGGTNWTTLGTAAALNNAGASQTWFNLIGAVDPNNPDVLIVGGLHLGKSTNAGDTWTTISSGAIHVDQHFLQYVGSSNLYIGNDGGAYFTTNADAAFPTFSNKNNGYNVTQYYATDFHPSNANYFLAGAQDNGTQKFNSAGMNTTTNATGGDGGFCHIDQSDGGVLQITAFTSNNYARSLNSGGSFSSMSSVNNNRGQFINPTDMDDDNNILYCGDDAGRYYYITQLEGTPIGNIANVSLMGSRELTAVKVDRSNANTIYVGASFGGALPQVLKISSSNSATPTVMTSATLGAINNATVSSIDIDPANNNHIVATLSNYGVVSVWESTNGGSSFVNIEGNLPDMPVRWAAFAPPNAQLNGPTGGNGGIMLATELGVWTTSAPAGAGTVWIPNNDGLANVRVDMIRYRASDNLVVAATHGRGLFTTILPTVVTGVPSVPVTKDFIKYISADNNQLLIVKGTLNTKSMNIQLFNMNGQQVYASKNEYQNIAINLGKLQAGVYIVKITGDRREHFVEQFVKRP